MKGTRKILALVLFGLLSLSFIGCNNKADPTGDNVGAFSSYSQIKDYIETLNESKTTSYSLFNTADVAEGSVDDSADYSQDASTDEREYSETNNQVEGVTEADKIVTDGYKIYIVSGTKFFIIDADTLNIDYTYIIEDGYMSDMYLYEGRVVLISSVYHYYEATCQAYPDIFYDEAGETSASSDSGEEYTCYRYTYGTQITILNVEDSEDVTISRELYFDSSYTIDSRMIDEQLYLILNNYNYYFSLDDEESFIPKYTDSVVSDELTLLPADRIYYMPYDNSSFSFLTLVSLDVTDTEAANVKAYLGSTWQIYMSENNLYTVTQRWTWLDEDGVYDYQTFVVRFEIVDNELVYKALGEIEGYPINQFSMDEYDGVFRIFTTGYTYDANGWQIDNFLFMLDATTDDTMEEISVLSNLGKPGERIYSARFVDDIGYVVTFEVIDPLYKIDLSDPENPEILGQLEEEGVSDYLHIITDDLMIGVGRTAEEHDGFVNFTGVKVTLYDTSGDNPINIDDYFAEGEYSYTNVMWDHKALLTFTPSDADYTYIGIPVYEYYSEYWTCSQNLYLFKVYHSGDLELVTKLTHMEEDEEGYYQYFDSIERALIIENNVYTVSYSSIRMFDMNDDFNMIAETELNPAYYDLYGYPETDDSDDIAD